MARVADVERMQMLVESASRRDLQRMLSAWLPLLYALRDERKAPRAAAAALGHRRRSARHLSGRVTSASSKVARTRPSTASLEVGGGLEHLDLGQQLVGLLEIVGVEVAIEQRQRLERRPPRAAA